jgi:hypothetical protein
MYEDPANFIRVAMKGLTTPVANLKLATKGTGFFSAIRLVDSTSARSVWILTGTTALSSASTGISILILSLLRGTVSPANAAIICAEESAAKASGHSANVRRAEQTQTTHHVSKPL